MRADGKRLIPLFYYFGTGIAKLLLVLLCRWRVKGKENVPLQGPLLVVANHLSMADPPILSASLPRPVIHMAKEELFRSWTLGPMVKHFGSILVKKGIQSRLALQQARQMLEAGLALAIFPEGTRSLTYQLQPALDGAALLALKSQVPILPVGIAGTERLKGGGWLLRPRIVIQIGQPFHLPQAAGSPTKAQLSLGTEEIMRQIAQLLPPSYRGVYNSPPQDIAPPRREV